MQQQSLLEVRLLEVVEHGGRLEGAAEAKPHTAKGGQSLGEGGEPVVGRPRVGCGGPLAIHHGPVFDSPNACS